MWWGPSFVVPDYKLMFCGQRKSEIQVWNLCTYGRDNFWKKETHVQGDYKVWVGTLSCSNLGMKRRGLEVGSDRTPVTCEASINAHFSWRLIIEQYHPQNYWYYNVYTRLPSLRILWGIMGLFLKWLRTRSISMSWKGFHSETK